MSSSILLSSAAKYSDDRVNGLKVSRDCFVTTDSMVQNKGGITITPVLPKGNLIAYSEGDILIGNIRPYLKKIWYANKNGGCSPDVLVIQAKSNIDSKFLYYSLFRNDFFSHMMNGSKGTKMPRGDKSQILRFQIPNIELSTQQKIASVLSALDSKIELNNRINAELEAMAKTLYDYWFVQFDFPFNFAQGKPDKNGCCTEPAEVKPYKTSGGKMIWNEELKREIPEGWDAGELNKLGDIIGGSTPSKAIEENFCTGSGMPWITPKDLSINKGKKYITRGEWDVTERGLKEASLKIMPPGTVLLSSRAPIGYLAIARTDVTTNQGFKSFIPKGIFNSEFIFYTIQNLVPEIEANSSGSTFKEVSSGTLKTIKTILPKESVLSEFDEKIKPIFKRQDKLELENQKLAELRDWLLPMLMNGQVKVSER